MPTIAELRAVFTGDVSDLRAKYKEAQGIVARWKQLTSSMSGTGSSAAGFSASEKEANRYASTLRQLGLEYQKVAGASKATTVQWEIEQGKLKALTAEQRDAVLAAARLIDSKKAEQAASRETAAQSSREAAEKERAARRSVTAAEKAAREEVRIVQQVERQRLAAIRQGIAAQRQARAELATVGSSASSAGRTMTTFVTLPVLAAGAAAIHTAMDFEAAMTKIEALAGVPHDMAQKWTAAVQEIAIQTGRAPKELAEALYFIASEGYRGAEALNVLTTAAKMSETGMGPTTATTKAIVFAVHDWAWQNLSAAKAADILTAAVREGNVAADSLVPALARVAPLASEMKIPFEQVASAFAVITREGFSAAEAGTGIRQMLATLEKNSPQTAKALSKVHLSAKQLREEMKTNLYGTLQHIETAFKGNTDQISKVFPNIRALIAFLGELNGKSSETEGINKRVAQSMGDAAKAFGTTTKTLQHDFNTTMAELQADGISLVGVLAPALHTISGEIRGFAKEFHDLSPEAKEAWAKTALFLAVLGPGLSIVGGGIKLMLGLDAAYRILFGSTKAATTVQILYSGAVTATATAEKEATVAALALAGAEEKVGINAEVAYGKVGLLQKAFGWLAGGTTAGTLGAAGLALGGVYAGMNYAFGPLAKEIDKGNEPWKTSDGMQKMHDQQLQYLIDRYKQYGMAGVIGGKAKDGTILPPQQDAQLNTSHYKDFLAWTIQAKTGSGGALQTEPTPKVTGATDPTGKPKKPKFSPEITGVGDDVLKALSQAIKTPKGEAACADFVSQMYQKMGLKVPHMTGANALAEWMSKRGDHVPISQAQKGDLIYYHGPQYGAIHDGQRSGGHVGFALGNGYMMDDHHRSGVKIWAPGKGATVSAFHMHGDMAAQLSEFASDQQELMQGVNEQLKKGLELLKVRDLGENALESAKMMWDAVHSDKPQSVIELMKANAKLQAGNEEHGDFADTLKDIYHKTQLARAGDESAATEGAAVNPMQELTMAALKRRQKGLPGYTVGELVLLHSAFEEWQKIGDSIDRAGASKSRLFDIKGMVETWKHLTEPADAFLKKLKEAKDSWNSFSSGMDAQISRQKAQNAGKNTDRADYLQGLMEQNEGHLQRVRDASPGLGGMATLMAKAAILNKGNEFFDLKTAGDELRAYRQAMKGARDEAQAIYEPIKRMSEAQRVANVEFSDAEHSIRNMSHEQALQVVQQQEYNEKLRVWVDQIKSYSETATHMVMGIWDQIEQKGRKGLSFKGITQSLGKELDQAGKKLLETNLQGGLEKLFGGVFAKGKPKDPHAVALDANTQALVNLTSVMNGGLGSAPGMPGGGGFPGLPGNSTFPWMFPFDKPFNPKSSEMGGGDFLSMITGGLFSAGSAGPLASQGFTGNAAWGLFAAGGDFSAGQPMIVGERGPEAIIPRGSGTVIPNHALGGTTNHINHTTEVHIHGGGPIDNHTLDQIHYAAHKGATEAFGRLS